MKKTDLYDKLYVIKSDGTTSVMGALNDVIINQEEVFGRPLQWFIRLSHCE